MDRDSENQLSVVSSFFPNFQVVWLNDIFGWGFWRKVWNRRLSPGDHPRMVSRAAAMLKEHTTASIHFRASRWTRNYESIRDFDPFLEIRSAISRQCVVGKRPNLFKYSLHPLESSSPAPLPCLSCGNRGLVSDCELRLRLHTLKANL